MSKPVINLSPEAKRRLQTERRRIARDQSKGALIEMEQARSALRSDSRNQKNRTKESQGIAIIRNLVSLCRAVNASFGVSVPIQMGEAPKGNTSPLAWTDGEKIVVKYPLPVADDDSTGNTVFLNDTESLKRLVSEVKALQYHELGHILFSQHINWMMADCGYGNDEWLKKYPTLPIETATSVRRSWNILEDQRMETALVAESPYLARYLTYLSVNWILNEANWGTENQGVLDRTAEKAIACQYLLVVNRRFLPIELRRKARNNFNTYFGDPATIQAEEVIRNYCKAVSVEDKVVAVIKFHQLLRALDITPPQFDDHSSHPRNGKRPIKDSADSAEDQDEDGKEITKGKSKDKTEPKDDANSDDKSEGSGSGDPHEGDDDPQDGGGSAKGDGDEGDDESSSSDGENNDDGGDGEGEGGSAGGGNPDNEKPQQDDTEAGSSEDDTNSDLKDLLDEIENEIINDSDIEDTVRAINEDFNRGDIKQLAPELSGTKMADENVNRARDIAYRLSTAFDSASSSALPIWEEGHREGVINAFRYRTRNAGDNEYRRTLTSTGNTGLDIAVTLMLDTSGSMNRVGQELGVSGFAVKEACDQVGIDCTVVTFDSASQELWRAIDRHVEPVALHPNGGTDPTGAFGVLDTHREEQKYHLVIILTDGVWSGDVKCHNYASDGRVFLGVAFGDSVDTEYLLKVGCDQVVTIDAIEQLPEVVRNFLLNFLG